MGGVDPNIALQVGRNLPQYGPDYNALAEMQRTAIAMQNAQRVQEGQNALRVLFSDTNNYDQKTLQPTQNAMAELMRLSPAAGMDLANNLAAVQEKRLRSDVLNSEVMDRYRGQARDIAAEALSAHDDMFRKTGSEKAAQAAGQQVYTGLVNDWKVNLPPDIASRVSTSFDPVRARATLSSAKMYEDVQKAKTMIPVKAAEAATVAAATAPVDIAKAKTIASNQTSEEILRSQATKEPQTVKVETVDGKTIDVTIDHNRQIRDAFTNAPIDPKTIKPGSLKTEAKGQDTFGKPVDIEVDDPENPGKTKHVLAQQGKNGQWVTADANRDPLPSPKSISSANIGAGGRESIYIQRALVSGEEAVSQLKTISQLPSGASSGWLGLGRTQGVSPFAATKEVLVNKVSSQEVQEYKTLAAGLQRELASLAASGVGVNQHYVDAFNSDMLAEGDTQETKLLKLARQRQTAENALEALLANPRLGKDQRTLAEKQIKGLQEAIPWTPIDVVNLLHSQKPGETLSDMAKAKGLGGNQEGKTVPVAPAQGASSVPEMTQEQYDKAPSGTAYRVPGNPKVMFKP